MVGFKREILTLDSSSTTFVPKARTNSLDTPKKAAMTFFLTLCLGFNSNPMGKISSPFEHSSTTSISTSKHSSTAKSYRSVQYNSVFGLRSRGQNPSIGPKSHYSMTSISRALSAESGYRFLPLSVGRNRGVWDTGKGAGIKVGVKETDMERKKEGEREGERERMGRSGVADGVSVSALLSDSHQKSVESKDKARARDIERGMVRDGEGMDMEEEVEGSRRAKQYAAAVVLERDIVGRQTKTDRQQLQLHQHQDQNKARGKEEEKEKVMNSERKRESESVIQNRLVHYGVYCGPGPADAFSGDNTRTHTHAHTHTHTQHNTKHTYTDNMSKHTQDINTTHTNTHTHTHTGVSPVDSIDRVCQGHDQRYRMCLDDLDSTATASASAINGYRDRDSGYIVDMLHTLHVPIPRCVSTVYLCVRASTVLNPPSYPPPHSSLSSSSPLLILPQSNP